MSGSMLNEDRFSKHDLRKSFNKSFQNDKEQLASRVNKNEVIKGYEKEIKKREDELDIESATNGEETKRAWKLMETINNLKQSLKLETDRIKELNGNNKKR